MTSQAIQNAYTFDEAVAASTEFFDGDKMAAESWVRKYALRDNGNILELTPADMHDRNATALASVEQDKEYWFNKFREQINKFKKLVLQGSPMAGLGNPNNVSLSNCFVLPSPSDSIKSIFDAVYQMAQIQAYRGGVGLDVSNLRPEGSRVSNAASISSGAWSWCDMFSYVSRIIGQNGRVGALMLTMRCDHPDIFRFVQMKSDLQKVTGANVSVRISDKLMEAVRDDGEFDLWFDFDNPKYDNIRKTIKARELWNHIVKYATKTAEPGILMWDNILRESPADIYSDYGFRTISTNPCSEINLCEHDACRLASINLTGFVNNQFSSNAEFDYSAFGETIAVGVRALDNIVDLDKLPFSEQKEKAEQGRRIGLGTHGLADCLAKLGLRYDSNEALKVVNQIYKYLRDNAYRASVELAEERGPFPIWDSKLEVDHPFLNRLDPDVRSEMVKHGRRNIALLTNAPTGTVSLMSRTSSGIEPIFRTHYSRRVKLNNAEDRSTADYIDNMGDAWKTHLICHPAVQEFLGKDKITEKDFEDLPDFFITSDSINWDRRIEIQSIMQQYIDHGISSTINLPKGTTEETVAKLYQLAWNKGLKGVTVYVDGSRDGVLITDKATDKIERRAAPNRPAELDAAAHTIGSNGKTYNVYLGFLGENVFEVFAVKQSSVGAGVLDGIRGKIIKRDSKHYDFESEAVVIKKINRYEDTELSSFTRLLSTALRHGVPIETISEQLHKSRGAISSMAKAINRVISKYAIESVSLSESCPVCKTSKLVLVRGCCKCRSCGYSSCG